MTMFFWITHWWGIFLGFFVLVGLTQKIRHVVQKRRFLGRYPTSEDLRAVTQVAFPEDRMSEEEAYRIWEKAKNETLLDEIIDENNVNQVFAACIVGFIGITLFAIHTYYDNF